MSQAEDLLNSLSSDDITLYTSDPATEEHIIINQNRNIIIPEPLKRIAVQYDHNIETVTFDCPRYWDGNDLSTMYIYINYITPDNTRGRYLVKNLRVNNEDQNTIHFEWTITKEITLVKGTIKFLVCAVKTDEEGNEEIHWNSELNEQMFVSNGLECNDVIERDYPDIINDLLGRMDNIIAADTPILDKSLTQAGLAADAKVTGDRIKSLASGSPLAASSIGEMTDTTRVYVNTTDGHWYYYNGSEWSDGGIYQASINSNDVNNLISMQENLDNLYNICDETYGFVNIQGFTEGGQGYNERASDFISVNNTKKLTVLLYIPKEYYENKTDNDLWIGIGRYNGDKEFISRITNAQINPQSSITSYTLPDGSRIKKYPFTLTDTTSFVRVSYRRHEMIDIRVINDEIKSYVSYCQSLKDFSYFTHKIVELSDINLNLEVGNISPDNGLEYFQISRARTKDFIKVGKGSRIYLKKNVWRRFGTPRFTVRHYHLDKTFNTNYPDPGWLRDEYIIEEDCLIKLVFSMSSIGSEDIVTVTDEEMEYFKDSIIIKRIDFDLPEPEPIVILNDVIKSINHRGYNTIAPENTLPAFKLSKQKGFDYVECDLDFTADNIPVIIHDNTINRTARNSDGSEITETLSVSNLTYQQLLNYDFGIWKNSEYAGTKIPTFEEFISLCQKINLKPYIEIKSSIDNDKIIELFNVLKRYNMVNKVTWISLNYNYLLLIKNYDNKARIGFITTSPDTSLINLYLLNLKTDENEVFLDIQNTYLSDLTNEIVTEFMTNNIGLEVWTVNTEQELLSVNSYISGVTSDCIVSGDVIFNANID